MYQDAKPREHPTPNTRNPSEILPSWWVFQLQDKKKNSNGGRSVNHQSQFGSEQTCLKCFTMAQTKDKTCFFFNGVWWLCTICYLQTRQGVWTWQSITVDVLALLFYSISVILILTCFTQNNHIMMHLIRGSGAKERTHSSSSFSRGVFYEPNIFLLFLFFRKRNSIRLFVILQTWQLVPRFR